MESLRTDCAVSLEQQLWSRWQTTPDGAIRAQLFDHYAGWSRMLAAHFRNRYPHPLAEFADYLSLASMGLLQAIDGYEPGRGTRFKAYAEPFIKGAILKGLACYVKERQYSAQERMNSLREEAEDDDFATIINLAVGLAFGHFLELGILEADAQTDDPSRLYERDNGTKVLAYLVEQLSANERQVITGHYYQQLSFVEISELLGVSKARVSQLHGQGLKKLRQLYEKMDGG